MPLLLIPFKEWKLINSKLKSSHHRISFGEELLDEAPKDDEADGLEPIAEETPKDKGRRQAARLSCLNRQKQIANSR